MKYDPRDDPIVKKLKKAKTEAERRKIERTAISETYNGPRVTDLPVLDDIFQTEDGN